MLPFTLTTSAPNNLKQILTLSPQIDKKTRDSALQSLRTYLSAQPTIPTLDLLKLHKGLFYCLWMQDKPALQQRLSRDLAGLVSSLQPGVVLPFIRAFFETMAREWGHIEALRLDKYLYLIRQYIDAGFKFLGSNAWEMGLVREWNEVLAHTALETSDMRIPNGLRYHVMDVWVDELERNGGEEWAAEKRREVLDVLVKPVENMAKEGKLKPLREAARECLGDERLRRWRGIEDEVEMVEEDDEEEAEWGGFAD